MNEVTAPGAAGRDATATAGVRNTRATTTDAAPRGRLTTPAKHLIVC